MKKWLIWTIVTIFIAAVVLAYFGNFFLFINAKTYFANKNYLNQKISNLANDNNAISANAETINTIFGFSFVSPWPNTKQTFNGGSFMRYGSGVNYVQISAFGFDNQDNPEKNKYYNLFKKSQPSFISENNFSIVAKNIKFSDSELLRQMITGNSSNLKFPDKKNNLILNSLLLQYKADFLASTMAQISYFKGNNYDGYKIVDQTKKDFSNCLVFSSDKVYVLEIKASEANANFLLNHLNFK